MFGVIGAESVSRIVRHKMKTILAAIALAAGILPSNGSFVPMSLENKSKSADVIIEGTVISITRLMPKEALLSGIDGAKGIYIGAQSIAVVRVVQVWKMPTIATFLPLPVETNAELKTIKTAMPQMIMIPCEYTDAESPSDLTAGKAYVMFLKDRKSNIYHPVDKASTHLIHDQRVASFGMNHPPDERFKDRSTPLAEFRSLVEAAVGAKH